MKKVKQIVLLVVALLLATLVILFMLENRTAVSVNLFKYATPELPIAVFITFSFILGLLIGPLFTWLPLSQSRFKCRRLAKKLHQKELELKQLMEATKPVEGEVLDSKLALTDQSAVSKC